MRRHEPIADSRCRRYRRDPRRPSVSRCAGKEECRARRHCSSLRRLRAHDAAWCWSIRRSGWYGQRDRSSGTNNRASSIAIGSQARDCPRVRATAHASSDALLHRQSIAELPRWAHRGGCAAVMMASAISAAIALKCGDNEHQRRPAAAEPPRAVHVVGRQVAAQGAAPAASEHDHDDDALSVCHYAEPQYQHTHHHSRPVACRRCGLGVGSTWLGSYWHVR